MQKSKKRHSHAAEEQTQQTPNRKKTLEIKWQVVGVVRSKPSCIKTEKPPELGKSGRKFTNIIYRS